MVCPLGLCPSFCFKALNVFHSLCIAGLIPKLLQPTSQSFKVIIKHLFKGLIPSYLVNIDTAAQSHLKHSVPTQPNSTGLKHRHTHTDLKH